MTFRAIVVDPLTEPPPAGWDAFAAAGGLAPGWHSGPLRAIDWCVPVASSMVMVAERGSGAPVGLFHTRHFSLRSPGRYVTPGRLSWPVITECRTAPVPLEAGLTFATGLDERDQVEAVRAFEATLQRRTGAGNVGIVYRNVLPGQLPVVAGSGRWRRPRPPRMVIDNDWPDLASYLRSLPGKWRSQLKKIRQEVGSDPGIRVDLADTIDPVQACWLAEVVRQRYTRRFPPRPPLPAHGIAQVARLPGSRFLTYRDDRDRLVGYAAVHDTGEDLHLIWWGGRGGTDGARRDLYFDHYLRLVEWMIASGRRRLILGGGMAQIKARYGAHPEPRWSVMAPAVATPGPRVRRWRGGLGGGSTGGPAGRLGGGSAGGMDAPARRGRRSSAVAARAASADAGAVRGGRARRLVGRWWTFVGRSPERAGSTARCRQCGEWQFVNVLRLSHRSARYWCGRCGAVVRLRGRQQLMELAPVRQFRAARPAEPDGADTGTLDFLPPAMLRWARTRFRDAAQADLRERSVLYHRYKEWDAYLRRLGRSGAARLARPEEPPVYPGLPPFSRVVGALDDACYDVDQATRQLRDGAAVDPEVTDEAVRERVEHARRWLARHGTALCWVHRRPPGSLAVPDHGLVQAALASLRAGAVPDPAAARAARAALFGTDGGPSLSTLLRTYPADRMVPALEAYLSSGARPLRDDVLSRLDASRG